MDNIQTEVLEIEFLTYSKGMTTISEEDFAKILLRFTNVENIGAYLENVRRCIPDEKVGVLPQVPLQVPLQVPPRVPHQALQRVPLRVSLLSS